MDTKELIAILVLAIFYILILNVKHKIKKAIRKTSCDKSV